jgi:hypothetical protein
MLLALEIDSTKVSALKSGDQVAVRLNDMMYRNPMAGAGSHILVREDNGDACMDAKPIEDRKQPPVSGTLGQQPVERNLEIEERVELPRADRARHRIDVLAERCQVTWADGAAGHR